MTTQNTQGAATEVERLDGEAENLAEQLASARRSVRDAEHELGTISARRKEIGLSVFEGDEAAQRELADLRARAASAEEALEVSGGASEQLTRLLEEKKKALAQARVRVHREEADELYRRSRDLDGRRDELAEELRAVLEEQARLGFDRAQAVRLYDGDEANRMAIAGDTTGDYLRSAFARWLG